MSAVAGILADVGGVDGVAAAARVGDNETRGALFRVVGVLALAVDGADGDAIYAVRVAVKVAVVFVGGAVAAGENVDGA